MALFDNIDLSHLSDLVKAGLEKGNEMGTFADLEEGTYWCTVHKLEARMTRETNKPMAVWELVVQNEGTYQNRHVWVNQVLESDTPQKTIDAWAWFKRTLAIFLGGYEIDDLSVLTEELIEQFILDKDCTLKVTKSSKGGTFMNIGPYTEGE